MKLTISGIDRLFLIVLTLFFVFNTKADAETLRIAVASNFLKPSQRLAAEFEADNGQKLEISSASSGKLFHQIMNGAPYDLFMSADSHKPTELTVKGKGISESLQTYARGQLSLWFKRCPAIPSVSHLKDESVKKIALANPKLAPYGLATHIMLEKKVLWRDLESKLVFPENISQVAQLAKMGLVDAAFIASSHEVDLLAGKRTENGFNCIIALPVDDYPSIEQKLVIMTESKHQQLAKRFIQFISSNKGQDLIKNMGYLLP